MIFSLKNLSLLYIALVALSFIVSVLLMLPGHGDVLHPYQGCYWTDALVPYIECRDIVANEAVKFFLNYWMYMLYIILFSVYLLPIPLAVLMWSPIVYLLWYFIKGRHLIRHSARAPRNDSV